MMLAILEVLLGRWFVHRSVHEAQIQELSKQNRELLKLVDDTQHISAAILKELRRNAGLNALKATPHQSTLH